MVRPGHRRREVRPIVVPVPEHEVAVLREAPVREVTNRIEALPRAAVTIHPAVVVLQDRAVTEVRAARREVPVPEVQVARREVQEDPLVRRAEAEETKLFAQTVLR